MSPGPPARLSLRGIGKVYPGTIANRDIDLEVAAGEIHAVLGENGAGKSTLMKIAYGVTQPSSGEIRWEGEPVVLRDPAHARSLGIGMVFQHFSLFESLTVVENAALALPGRPDLADLARRIEAIGLRYGLPVDPGRRVLALSIGERQRVEIIRCLLQNPRLLIMDEPTSVLTPDAVRRLFEVLRQLAAQGCSILYISHKLEEIRELCHRATVLRGGQVTGRCVPAEESAASLARMMIGEAPLQVRRDAGRVPVGEVRLQLVGLSLPSEDPYGVALHDIDLEVRAGEIVGIAGVSGNGQQELLRAISGETLVEDDAAIRLFGQPAGRAPVARRRARGMGLVPEERLGRGAVPQMNLAENALLTAHRQGLCRAGFIDFAAARRFAAGCIERFGVKASGPQAQASALSGGNLQKFIVAREIAQQPGLLVAAQPTWGVDVGAAVFLRGQLMALRDRGAAVLVVSEELDELFEICDRIAVLAAGRLSSARPLAECRREAIGRLMGGAMADDAVAHCAS